SGELYGAIELSTEGIKVVALRISRSAEESGLKLLYSEVIRLPLGRNVNRKFDPSVGAEAALCVQRLFTQLRQRHKVADDRIYLIGSSELGADQPEELIDTIKKLTGKTPAFLDSDSEAQFTIAGTISQRGKVGGTMIDNRNSSVLIRVGSYSTKGG